MKRKDPVTSLGSLVRGVLEMHPAFSPNPLGDWVEIAGEQVANHSQPKTLKDRVLVIVAYDSVWRHHLELQKEELMRRINGNRPEPIVERITVKVGEIQTVPPVLNPSNKKLQKVKPRRLASGKKQKTALRPLTAEERSLLASLRDPELKKIGKRLLQRIPLD